MVTLANLRHLYGDVVETATIARSLLAPVASQLSGDPSALHRRCVLAYCLDFFREPADVHADVAPFGAVEAVAHCDIMTTAVVVFRDEASVAVALRRQAETSDGLFSAVPPLDKALPLRCAPPELIKVLLNPPAPPPSATPRRLRPLFSFRQFPGQPFEFPFSGPPGTTRFLPFYSSRVYGPVVGADGHLWMDGQLYYFDVEGVRVDPAWIRVVRIDRPGTYAGGLPTFVPYVCYC